MAHSIKDIAAALGAEAFGDVDILIDHVAEPADAGPGDLALATNQKYAEQLAAGGALAAMLWPGADWETLGLKAAIIAPRPRFAMAGLTAMMDPGQGYGDGIHPSAVIDPSAEIGTGVSIGALSVVAAGARIGAGSVIGPQCHIGQNAVLGDFAFLREQVSIGARARIGDRFIAQPGARIGGDGFSYVTPERAGVEEVRETLSEQGDAQAQSWARIHSLGAVQIGNDVEIGANACIDNGTVRDTQVGDGTKIDDLAQVAHNVVIGRDCLLCGQVGIAGSTQIGNNVVLGGQSGVVDNIFIGDRVIAGGGTKVLSNVPAGRVMMGYPATKMETHVDTYKATRRLPRLMREVEQLKQQIAELTGKD